MRVEIRTDANDTIAARVVNNVKQGKIIEEREWRKTIEFLSGVPQTVTIEHISPDSLVSTNNYKVISMFYFT